MYRDVVAKTAQIGSETRHHHQYAFTVSWRTAKTRQRNLDQQSPAGWNRSAI